MIADVIDGGKLGMDTVLFGVPQSASNLPMLVDNSKLINTSTFYNNSINMLNDIYRSDQLINMAKSIIVDAGTVYGGDYITRITRNNIHNANSIMRDIIISHPDVHRLDNLGVISGYSDANYDNTLSELVNSGTLYVEDNLIVNETYFNTAYMDYNETDIGLIKDAWKVASDLLAEGIDPTDDDLRPF